MKSNNSNNYNSLLNISKDYFDELVDFHSAKTVGKILKRFDLYDDKKIIKNDVRELIYESYRDLRDLIIAHSYGFNMTVYNFKSNKRPKGE